MVRGKEGMKNRQDARYAAARHEEEVDAVNAREFNEFARSHSPLELQELVRTTNAERKRKAFYDGGQQCMSRSKDGLRCTKYAGHDEIVGDHAFVFDDGPPITWARLPIPN